MVEKKTGASEMLKNLELAEDALWVEFQRSGAFKHRGLKGTGREDAVMAFLNSQLPSRFRAVGGEVVDVGGKRSGQVDILIYDHQRSAPLYSQDNGTVLIPVEAVLTVIEVKSQLTRNEIKKTVAAMKLLRILRPWGKDWARYRPRGTEADDGPRCFSSLLAFTSNLGDSTWAAKELARVRDECVLAGLPAEHIDRVVVLSNGVILPAEGLVTSNDRDRRALGTWYFTLLNFLSREVERREPLPWSDYESWEGRKWDKVLDPLFTAPAPKIYTPTQIGKYKSGRGAQNLA